MQKLTHYWLIETITEYRRKSGRVQEENFLLHFLNLLL